MKLISCTPSRSCRNVSNGTNEYGSDTGYLSSDRAGAINKVTRSGSNSSGNNSTNTFSRAWDDDSEDSSTDLDSLTKRNSRDNRYMSFHDASSPYGRVPLADKVTILRHFPFISNYQRYLRVILFIVVNIIECSNDWRVVFRLSNLLKNILALQC